MIHIKLLIDIIIYKSITIRCTKCQIFGIWHTKHKKQIIMRCVKCEKIMKHATIPFHLWHGTNQNGIWCLLFFILFSLSSLITLFLFFLVVIWWVGSTVGVFSLFRSPSLHHLMLIFVFFVVVFVFVFLWWWFWCSAVGVLVWDGGGWSVDGC